jgi:hypothetical protein
MVQAACKIGCPATRSEGVSGRRTRAMNHRAVDMRHHASARREDEQKTPNEGTAMTPQQRGGDKKGGNAKKGAGKKSPSKKSKAKKDAVNKINTGQ